MRSVSGEGLGLAYSRLPPNDKVAFLEGIVTDQRAVIDCLKGALAADHLAQSLSQPRAWMSGLTRQGRALVGALIAVSPRPIPIYDLLDMLPGHDSVAERNPVLVAVLVGRVREKLGKGVICNQHGEGYFIPKAECDRLLALTS